MHFLRDKNGMAGVTAWKCMQNKRKKEKENGDEMARKATNDQIKLIVKW